MASTTVNCEKERCLRMFSFGCSIFYLFAPDENELDVKIRKKKGEKNLYLMKNKLKKEDMEVYLSHAFIFM